MKGHWWSAQTTSMKDPKSLRRAAALDEKRESHQLEGDRRS